MAERKILLKVAYDGSSYGGWAVQPDKPTVQGLLQEAVKSLVGHKVLVLGASRTDARVSALGQSAMFTTTCPIPTENFAKAISDRLPDDIEILEAVEAPKNFDPIGGVTNKMYRYSIYTGKKKPVLHIRHCWHFPEHLDAAAMNQAAQLLVGKKDFKSFAAADDKRKSSVRTIFRSEVTSDGDWVYYEVEGDGFLYNMVRNIVGTLVEVGRGRWQPEKINEILEARTRTAAGMLAPASGLCLMWIKYDER